MRSLLRFGHIAVWLVMAVSASAQVPRTLSYQGVLADANGRLLPDGVHTIRMNLYESLGSVNAIYSETQPVTIVRGSFNVIIGTATPIPTSLQFDRAYFLGVTVDGGDELQPRTVLTAAPYALHAAVADGLAPGATGVVTSVNGIEGVVHLEGSGGTTVSQDGNTIKIESSGGTGGFGLPFRSIGTTSTTGPLLSISGNANTAGGAAAPIIEGVNSRSGGVGVRGAVSADAAFGIGVLGTSSSTTAAIGVQGRAEAVTTSTPSIGVHGVTASSFNGSVGVFGEALGRDGYTYGVYGTSQSNAFGTITGGVSGVYGEIGSNGGVNAAGVRGINYSNQNLAAGVFGYSVNGSGVWGQTSSRNFDAAGVFGRATDGGAGVSGETRSPLGPGVRAVYAGSGVGNALEVSNGPIKVSGASPMAFDVEIPFNSGESFTIDNPLTNGDDKALIFITDRSPFSFSDLSNVTGPHVTRVYFNIYTSKWEIACHGCRFSGGAKFNVLVIKR
jgi:hypothetical protein